MCSEVCGQTKCICKLILAILYLFSVFQELFNRLPQQRGLLSHEKEEVKNL